MLAGLLRLVLLITGIVLTGCSNIDHSLKGAPVKLSGEDQATVEASLTSQRRIAVVVGINEFDDAKWDKLRYPVKDAEDFAAVLNDQRYGHFDKVITLTTREETTRSRILAAPSFFTYRLTARSPALRMENSINTWSPVTPISTIFRRPRSI